MKTYYLVEVDHRKPLPTGKLDPTDVISQRVYMWLYSCGVEAGVTAKLLEDAMKEKTDEAPVAS